MRIALLQFGLTHNFQYRKLNQSTLVRFLTLTFVKILFLNVVQSRLKWADTFKVLY